MNEMWTSIVTIATAIVGVAILAVIVSQRSNTAQVIQSAGQAFASDIGAAVSPITGGSGFGSNILGGMPLSGGANYSSIY